MFKKLRYLLLLFLPFILSCEQSTKNSNVMVLEKEFGTLPDGQKVTEYRLINQHKVEFSLINYGGIITSLKVPDREGNLEDIVLGYDNLAGYLDKTPYFGATVGRYGNRIAKGSFTLDSVTYDLAINNDVNHLHGGIKGFDKVVWKAEVIESDSIAGVKLTYTSPHMEEGYPGKLSTTVTYSLDNDDQLIFEYEASTDRKTVINLTNHSYFNLSGMENTILDHEVMINADRYLPVDSTLIPLEIAPVENTPFDFTEPKKVGRDIGMENIQLANGGGYDHCWVLNGDGMKLAATVYEANSGRFMAVYTSEPGVQFYTGNFLDGTITGKNDVVYNHRMGLCLETQHFPDSPNRPDFPSVILNPGEKYYSKTVTKFSTK